MRTRALQAADDATTTRDIVVTASLFRRTDTETPAPATKLTADTLAKAGINNASEAVRSISADSFGSMLRPSPTASARARRRFRCAA